MSSFCTPFWNEMMPVSGPTIGRSWRAASSVSQSLTQNITMSTGPMVGGIVGDVDLRQVDRLVRALDRQAMLAHGREMAAARHEGHVRAALDQPRAEDSRRRRPTP